jgi:hypothetical protein
MTTFREVVEAWIASKEHCAGSLGRIQFWVDQFGHLPITEVSEDDVDRALEVLVSRGKLKPGRNGTPRDLNRRALGRKHRESVYFDPGWYLQVRQTCPSPTPLPHPPNTRHRKGA